MTDDDKTTAEESSGDRNGDALPSLGAAFCSALYDVYHANNDYDCTGATVSEAYADANFELATGIAATLFLRHDLTREQALKEVDNLRWLVEQRFPQNVKSSDGL
jgi:hypothetical protein